MTSHEPVSGHLSITHYSTVERDRGIAAYKERLLFFSFIQEPLFSAYSRSLARLQLQRRISFCLALLYMYTTTAGVGRWFLKLALTCVWVSRRRTAAVEQPPSNSRTVDTHRAQACYCCDRHGPAVGRQGDTRGPGAAT